MSTKNLTSKSSAFADLTFQEKSSSGKYTSLSELVSKTLLAKQAALEEFNSLPSLARVRIPVVMSLLSVSRSTVWRLVSAGKLKTYKLTPRTTTFSVGELRALLAAKEVQ